MHYNTLVILKIPIMGCRPVEMTLVAPNGAVPLTGMSYFPIKLVSTSESNNDGALLPT